MGKFIKLFLLGVLVIALFSVAVSMLPYVIVGFVVLYLYDRYFGKDKADRRE